MRVYNYYVFEKAVPTPNSSIFIKVLLTLIIVFPDILNQAGNPYTMISHYAKE